MKNAVLVFALLSAGILFSQSGTGWGIKGGLNYGSTGKITEDVINASENPDNSIGFHLGIYGKLGNRFYLRPELVYSNINSDYDTNFKMQKLDLPILAGLKILGPLHVFAGPSFQYILDTDLEDFSLGDIENDFTVGLNIGVGVNLGSIGIDLRYERGFSRNEIAFFNEAEFPISGRIDTRPEQLIISASIRL